MKNKNIVMIIAALCIVSMGACFSPWDGSGDQGNLVINLGDSGARYAKVPNDVVTVILSSSGETSRSEPVAGNTASFSVQPGHWNILVRVDNNKALKVYGKADVEVKAGAVTDVTITMGNRSGVAEVVNAWTDLKNVLEKTAGNPVKVMITNRALSVTDFIEIPKGKTITLLAEVPVTIRKDNIATYSMFRVPDGSSLILGEEGWTGGSITIDGSGGNARDNSSLIYVGTSRFRPTQTSAGPGGTLTMYDGVRLINNEIVGHADRGGAVVVQGGTFNMKGGEIFGNKATYGGGVLVMSSTVTGTVYKGTFNKEKGKGRIYGNTAKNKSNGHAVAVVAVSSSGEITDVSPIMDVVELADEFILTVP
jgi:hypothetical protein